MNTVIQALADLEAKAVAGQPFTRAEAERVLAATDLVSVGMLGESARRAHSADTITFGRVAHVPAPPDAEAGELRITAVPRSVAEAIETVRVAAATAGSTVLTGFSLADLADLCSRDVTRLGSLAGALQSAGLAAIAETPVDRFPSVDALVAAVEVVTAAGLRVWRATVDSAGAPDRLDLIVRAATLQDRTGALRAFAPLPRIDPADVPSTGYDDVRTVAVTRLVCAAIPYVQVDWPLYGPKLAQVAIAFGANDIDGVDAVDTLGLGPRRSPVEDIRRQIGAASGVPAERDGRYEPRP